MARFDRPPGWLPEYGRLVVFCGAPLRLGDMGFTLFSIWHCTGAPELEELILALKGLHLPGS